MQQSKELENELYQARHMFNVNKEDAALNIRIPLHRNYSLHYATPAIAHTFVWNNATINCFPGEHMIKATQRYLEARIGQELGMDVANPDAPKEWARENRYAYMAIEQMNSSMGRCYYEKLDALAKDMVESAGELSKRDWVDTLNSAFSDAEKEYEEHTRDKLDKGRSDKRSIG